MATKKGLLHLSVDNDLVNLAKSSNYNLSQEFEDWIRIRLNQTNNNNPVIDIDKEVARYHMEIQKLLSKKELEQEQKNIENEKKMVIDNYINNLIKFKEETDSPSYTDHFTYKDLIDKEIHGLIFLFKKKFNIDLSVNDSREIITNALKEKGLL
jgi:hypothetical protein